MKLLSLKLRGSIGVKKGLGLDEVEIDFTQFGPGLVAFTGKNGTGKSTLLENCHPYRCMVSRGGSLQSHFELKDSYRILKFEFEGKVYESRILIDALTGGSEAYLYCNGIALNDGKLTTFDEILESTIGSQELFFNSVFSGQKSKGIAELKPADRRKLFYELLNLTVYETYLEEAKSNLKSNEIKLAEIEGQINSLNANPEDLTQLESNRINALNTIADTEIKISKVEDEIEKLTKNIRDLEITAAKLDEKRKSNDEILEKMNSLAEQLPKIGVEHSNKMSKLEADRDYTKREIGNNNELLQNRDEIEKQLKKKADNEAELNGLNNLRSSLMQKKNDLNQKYNEELQSFNVNEEEIKKNESALNHYDSKMTVLKSKLDQMESDILLVDEVPCTEEIGNGCQFLKNAYSSKESYPELEAEYNSLSEKRGEYAKLVEDGKANLTAQKQVASERYNLDHSKVSEDLMKAVEIIESLEASLNEAKGWEKQKADLKDAETNLKVLNEKLENIDSFITIEENTYKTNKARIKKEIEDLDAKFEDKLGSKIEQVRSQMASVEAEREAKSDIRKELISSLEYMKGTLADCEAQIQQINQNKQKVEELNVKKVCVQSEIKDWTFLTKAFDKTGIPVLKLENSGVEITTIANELLSLFENKFRIVFETTTLTRDKKKMKETFDINIVEDDGVCEISNKSGGQQVWLETAIQSAISLVVRNQGRNIETSFLDEKDGALDLENAHSYIEMIQKAHQMSGVHNTFVITHRTELLDFIPQQIKLADGVLSILN